MVAHFLQNFSRFLAFASYLSFDLSFFCKQNAACSNLTSLRGYAFYRLIRGKLQYLGESEYAVSRIFMSVAFLNRFAMFNLVKTANTFIEIVENGFCIF